MCKFQIWHYQTNEVIVLIYRSYNNNISSYFVKKIKIAEKQIKQNILQSILWFQFNTIKLVLALVWTVEVQYNEVIRFRSHAKNSHLFFAEWVRTQMWAMWSEDGLRPDHLRTLNFSTCCTFQLSFFNLCLIWADVMYISVCHHSLEQQQ